MKSRSPADGREETGEGRILDGAVPGDIEVDKVAFFGIIVEGSEGVEVCQGEFKLSSPGLRSTKYDNGGGGARGPYSSTFADRNCRSSLLPGRVLLGGRDSHNRHFQLLPTLVYPVQSLPTTSPSPFS